jgi:hypothetical protein
MAETYADLTVREHASADELEITQRHFRPRLLLLIELRVDYHDEVGLAEVGR